MPNPPIYRYTKPTARKQGIIYSAKMQYPLLALRAGIRPVCDLTETNSATSELALRADDPLAGASI